LTTLPQRDHGLIQIANQSQDADEKAVLLERANDAYKAAFAIINEAKPAGLDPTQLSGVPIKKAEAPSLGGNKPKLPAGVKLIGE